jgi:hypothetical protein
MKRVLLIPVILFFIAGYTANGQKKEQKIRIASESDSVSYELIVFDAGFDAWLLTKPSVNFRSQKYYESRNRQYVSEWNYRCSYPDRYGLIYDSKIDYDPFTDYGLELNYRLFYYFQYFEEKNSVDFGVSRRL